MPRKALDGVWLEQFGAVLDAALVTGRLLVEMQCQIELREFQIEIKSADLESAEFRVDSGQHLQGNLKDWVSAQIPFESEMSQHQFKRQVAVGEGIENALAAPAQ